MEGLRLEVLKATKVKKGITKQYTNFYVIASPPVLVCPAASSERTREATLVTTESVNKWC